MHCSLLPSEGSEAMSHREIQITPIEYVTLLGTPKCFDTEEFHPYNIGVITSSPHQCQFASLNLTGV